ncbi:MAG: superoxide dismutase [Candidatus Eremiobacteraeota bacterium]|nr:superoxide dismutase [Candidatus Eremiobacteraeota bacterium]
MAISTIQAYTPKKWNLAGLKGISDKTLEVHFGLYEGYVKNTNLLNERLAEMGREEKQAPTNPAFAELTRRLGWEYNGMVLHEYYFDNLTNKGNGGPASGRLHEASGESFGDFEAWKKNFAAVGGMRGIGWAIAFQDGVTGRISNHWIDEHHIGNVAGFAPVVVMDVWEHAFMFDYKPAERANYIEAFFSNVDWKACESRLIR